MSRFVSTAYSVLDLCPILEGGEAAEAFGRAVDLSRHVESWGYRRYWLAEHHNMPGIASAATSVVIGHVAGATKTIRVGAGGVMLPNHAPLVIAEQFGTLESLYPGRIDLGLGRAPGTDPMTSQALRRENRQNGDQFPALLTELREYFRDPVPGQRVRAVPGAGLRVPIWLLGSGGFSAQLAGELGLPFSSAGHFSPANMLPGLEIYRKAFRPSTVLEQPYVMVGINVIAAATDAEAQHLATSHQQAVLNMFRDARSKLPPPVDTMEDRWMPHEKAGVESFLKLSMVGSPATVRLQLDAFLEETRADEVIINSMIYDHTARVRSYEIVADIFRGKV
ncbi:MAG: LLM class flavin-dependent oxidoreductase [Chthoniobacteraceae bacterium]